MCLGKVGVVNLSVMSYEDKQGLIILIWLVILYLLRKHKPFDTIWAVVKVFLIIVFIVITAGMAAKWVKSWFD